MTIGEKIRLARTGRELSRKELADISGMADVSIRNYENEKRQPTIEQLQKIADGLQVNISYFFGASKPSQHAVFINWLESLGYWVGEREDNSSYNIVANRSFDGCNLSEAEFTALVKSVSDYTKFVIKTAIDEKGKVPAAEERQPKELIHGGQQES